MHTDVVKCDGCGADVVVVLRPHQITTKPVFCPGCTKLNAAKASYTQAQRVKQVYYQQFIGGKSVAYQKRSGGYRPPPGQSFSTPYSAQGQSTQNAQCSFTWDVPRQAYAVTAAYQPNFIEFIKAKVPVSDRVADYNSITRKFKCWYIKEAWFDVLNELASQLWPNQVHVLTRETAEAAWKAQEQARLAALTAQRAAVLGPFEAALLDFASLCDVDSLRAARNKMAIMLHPDKGGDPDKMAKLNASWFIVETELRKRSESK